MTRDKVSPSFTGSATHSGAAAVPQAGASPRTGTRALAARRRRLRASVARSARPRRCLRHRNGRGFLGVEVGVGPPHDDWNAALAKAFCPQVFPHVTSALLSICRATICFPYPMSRLRESGTYLCVDQNEGILEIFIDTKLSLSAVA